MRRTKYGKRYLIAAAAGAGLAMCTGRAQADLLAGWDFQTTTNGGTALATAPNTPNVITANFGLGTMYLDGSNGSSSFVTATSGNELTAFAGTTNNAGTGFSSTTSGAAALGLVGGTTNSANGKALTLAFSMANYQDLVLSYSSQRTGTGFTGNQWAYSTDGTTWTNVGSAVVPASSFATVTIDLSSISAIDNDATVWLRYMLAGASSSSGNNRIDNLQLNASAFTGNPGAELLTWSGANGTAWDLTTVNFINASSTPTDYDEGDTVTFTDAGAGTVNVDAGGVSPASVNVASNAAYNFTGGAIGGTSSFSKSGTGTTTLSNTNTFTGGTAVTDGTLTFAGAGTIGLGKLSVGGANATVDLAGTNQSVTDVTLTSGKIIGSGALNTTSVTAINGTISASLGGASSTFTKTGSGTVVLTGTHTYGGATSIAAGGTLIASGSVANSAVAVNGTLNIGGSNTAATISAASMTFAGGSNLGIDLGTDKIVLSGDLTVNGGTINMGLKGTAGATYTIAEAANKTGTSDFTMVGKPSGVASVAFAFEGGAYKATLVAGQTGVGANAASLTSDGVYFQDFNSLANTGTSTAVPAGVAYVESNGDTNYTASDGSGTGVGGNTFSYGANESGERALGSLQSGSNISTIGFNIRNDTGATMDDVAVSYVGEQWRLGALNRADRLDFQFSFDATSLTTGTWFDLDALDFNAPTQTATGGAGSALDGNDPANQVLISGVIPFALAADSGIWFRWVDFDASGAEDGLAIDNLMVVPEPASMSLVALGALGLMRRRRRVTA